MKLYFYFLNLWNENPIIKCEECEVEEKPKTYKFKENCRPKGYYYNTVKKEDIGKINSFQGDTAILLEKNDSKAIELFKAQCRNELCIYEDKISAAQANIERINTTISMLDEYN